MAASFPPIVLPFAVRTNDDHVAPLGRLFYFPGSVKVTEIGVILDAPLSTADVLLDGALWPFERDVPEFLKAGPREFLDEIGPTEALRLASNKVLFDGFHFDSTNAIKIFPMAEESVGNVFVLELALGNYAPATLVSGRLSIRSEAIEDLPGSPSSSSKLSPSPLIRKSRASGSSPGTAGKGALPKSAVRSTRKPTPRRKK